MKYSVIFIVFITILFGIVGLVVKKQSDKISSLTSQVAKHQQVREKMCDRVLSVVEGTAAVAHQTSLSIEDRQRLRTDLLVVGTYAEGCVRLPDVTKKAMEGCQNGNVDDDLLKQGVWSLDQELKTAQKSGWQIEKWRPK